MIQCLIEHICKIGISAGTQTRKQRVRQEKIDQPPTTNKKEYRFKHTNTKRTKRVRIVIR